jgi:hypothetical protein
MLMLLTIVAMTGALPIRRAEAQIQDVRQQKCIVALNKGAATAAKQQGKLNAKCVKDAGKDAALDAEGCVATPSTGVQKAVQKTADQAAKNCGEEIPDFGATDADTANGAAIQYEVALLTDVLGESFGAAIVPVADDKVGAICQSQLVTGCERIAAAKAKAFLSCAQKELKDESIDNAAGLEACFDDLHPAASKQVSKSVEKLGDVVAKRCGDVAVDEVFPGACAGAGDFAGCVHERVDCAMCLLFNAVGDLDRNCDLFDDDSVNGSCTRLAACGDPGGLWGSNGSGDGQMNFPAEVTVGGGNVYVVDQFNNRIQKFDLNGQFLTKWGSFGNGNGQFSLPYGIAVNQGGVYVSDQNNSRIQKFDSSGTFITSWGSFGSGPGQFSYPAGIAADGSGNVYVADQNNHRIQKFDSNGAFLTEWGINGSGDGEFSFPAGVATDTNGNVYVVDRSNNRIQRFDSTGAYLGQWGTFGSGNGELAFPQDVDVDASGSVYVTDANNDRVQKFLSDGTYVTSWGTLGQAVGELDFPVGIASDGNGKIYVVDSNNSRIQTFVCP